MKGAHRLSRIKNSERTEYGAYLIQCTTRFSQCKRLQLSTSIYPDTKNAATIIAEMKLMLKELNREGRVEQLLQLREQKVKLIDLYSAWKKGKAHLLQGNEQNNLLAELDEYRKTSGLSLTTTKTSAYVIRSYQTRGFIRETHTLSDLPHIVQKLQHHFSKAKKHDMFNYSRQHFLAFLHKHCGHSKQSSLYLSVQNIESLRITNRKPHHPFATPRELFDICEQITKLSRITPVTKLLYTDCLKMMTLHAFRPSEFLELKWERDNSTGHLRIKGTKTAQSNRVVPSLLYPKHYNLKTLSERRVTQNALNKVLRNLHLPHTSRDCRRTFSVWAEKAGIERSHILAYMGHKGREMTDLYQTRAITRDELDVDAQKMNAFIDADLKRVEVKKKSHFVPTT